MIGNIYRAQSLRAIWNGEEIQRIRREVLENRIDEVCNLQRCPYARNGNYIDLDAFTTEDAHLRKVVDEIKQGSVVLKTGPVHINLADSNICNLKCRMCLNIQPNRRLLHQRSQQKFNALLQETLPDASELLLTGNGDPFARTEVLHLLKFGKINEIYPHIRIQMITNGMLLTEDMWEKIKHNHFSSISVSVDAATKETYEYIRRRGQWEILMKNLSHLAQLRRNGHFGEFHLTFVVQKSNYQEMRQFAELGTQLGCDTVLFQKIIGYRDVRENIFFTRNINALSSIGKILDDPVLCKKGIDVSRIIDYKKFSNVKESFFNRIGTKLRESLFYWPMKVYYLLRQQISVLYSRFFY